LSSLHVSPGPTALIDTRDEVRRRLATGDLPAGGLTIELAGGDYPIGETIHFGPQDAGTSTAPVTWRARAGETARLLGGVLLHDFAAVTDAVIRQRLAPEAREHVVQVDLRACGVTDFGDPVAGGLELFFAGKPMTLARWPKEGFVIITGLVGGDPVDVRGTKGDLIGRFHYDGDRPSRWLAEADPWVHGYWFWDWSDQRQRVSSIDPETRTISVTPPYHNYGYRIGQWFYAYNLLCELDSPGEFYVDRQAGMLYFWPPASLDGVEVAVSVADTLVSLQGADHLRLNGLSFVYGRDTALKITAASSVHVERCCFRNLGGWATRVDGGRDVTIAACQIEATGNGGVYLSGGDRPSLTASNHVVEDCHIHHYGRVNRMYQPAVQLVGVGQRASHNHIHDAPHMAVQFAGNDHVIEFNDVHHVCQESNDAGAVYSGRDWTWRGTIIRYNRFWEITGFENRGCVGVYLDDMLCATHVHGNLFWRVTRATMIGGGRDCLFENNLYVDCTPCVHLDARAMNWANYHVGTTMKDRLDEMPVHEPLWCTRYPELHTIWEDEPAAPKGNIIRCNVSQGGDFDGVREDAREYVDLTDNFIADDVGLVGTPPHSFALRADSPAWVMGFQAIPEDRIGPRR
jgi:hypothetical protein